jgi:hypothetical protein
MRHSCGKRNPSIVSRKETPRMLRSLTKRFQDLALGRTLLASNKGEVRLLETRTAEAAEMLAKMSVK